MGGREAGFWDKIADKYSGQPIADQATYEKKLAMTREHLTSKMSVLEYGCGTGSTAIAHAPYVKPILATDISDAMLAHGRRKAEAAGLENITFERASVEELAESSPGYDVVLALNIIHLCRDPQAVIAKTARLLQPGGIFIQSTACLIDYGPLMRVMIPVMRLIGKAPYVAFFSPEDLFLMLDKEGFDIVETYDPGKRSAKFIIARKRMT